MTDTIDDQIPFFNLLYDNQVYHIRQKKYASGSSPKIINAVLEEQGVYQSPEINFQGINSPTLLLFSYSDGGEIPAQDRVFLDQILKATGLNFENLSWLNTSNLPQNISWHHISAQTSSEFVIAFGINGKYLPDGVSEGQVYNGNNKRVLCVPTLSQISLDSSGKKLLWQGLKEIYGL